MEWKEIATPFLTLSFKNYAIWLIFECARAKMARKSWDLLHRSCWVALEIHTWRTSLWMEIPLLLAKSELLEGRNSKNGEINVFLDCFQLILMSFLTTSLHKNSKNDVKLLETWWFWNIGQRNSYLLKSETPWISSKITMNPKISIKPCVPWLK